MTRKLILFLAILPLFSAGQSTFFKYFTNKSLRFDFLLGGNYEDVVLYPQQLKEEPYWAGSLNNLIDTFNYGTYRFCVFDKVSGSLIFSKGFCTLFQEWQTTADARKNDNTFYQAVIFPRPKNIVRLEIDARQRNGRFRTIFETEIDPDDYHINKDPVNKFNYETIMENGKPEKRVDIVILAEGYTYDEMDKFIKDARRVTGYLFDEEPFKSEKSAFNVKAVFTPSQNSGTDIPGEGIYKNTFYNSTFYTFDIPRYLTTSDIKTIYDAAAVVPYDQIYLLVNTDRYGGGGFYNFINVCSADNYLTSEVFVHEFGNGFAGLGDEYYDSEVAYENYYNLEIEPWEPNLTTLVNFGSKWQDLISDSIPVPTPREPRYSSVVGLFEGGGYMTKGIYSPVMDCRMKNNRAGKFCPVCNRAIRRMIDFHCK